MPTRRLKKLLPIGLLLLITVCPAHSQQVPYESNVLFMNTVAADLVKLLPRAMGSFLYQNRVGFARGMTFVERSIRVYPLKMKDLEELRGTAYARLMRDIPYCVQAFKGGDIKMDTSPSNLAARLGMISYWIFLQKLPAIGNAGAKLKSLGFQPISFVICRNNHEGETVNLGLEFILIYVSEIL